MIALGEPIGLLIAWLDGEAIEEVTINRRSEARCIQRWEYLRVSLCRDAWTDSHGRQGTLSHPWAGTWKDFANSGQVSIEFGAEGWELTTYIGTAGNSFILFFKRSAEG